ncbi:MAG: AraC family transcriptional regulator N-terminal domain-containing protein [Bacteroidia bacterium]|nr:AraC family transcriptional regulator N-terminal domain-containing protein [Bacteroidia bacterium]
MYQLDKINTTRVDKLKTEVEQRTTFTLNRCELNIFETHRKAENVKLSFEGFTITSMLRGKKILKLDEEKQMNYIPGETFILPSAKEMVIDFPEANYSNPTQCTALVIEDAYLKKQLDYINETFPRHEESGNEWQLSLNQQFLQNDEMIVSLGNRLIRIFSGNDPMKDILVDIKLKELVLSIMRLQNFSQLDSQDFMALKVNARFKAVADYIRRNITADISVSELSNIACMSKSVFYRSFTNEFGIPPNKMILTEKIKYAKQLMDSNTVKIKEVCFASGFSDPNYFSRIFKKLEGITPGEYLSGARKSAPQRT